MDPNTGFHCYPSLTACASSPLNTCGPLAAGTLNSGVSCGLNFTNPGIGLYTPCQSVDTFQGSGFLYYCSDSSDGLVEVDPVTQAECFASQTACNSSPLNRCNPSAGTPCLNVTSTLCTTVDSGYDFACPLSPTQAGSTSTDDAVSNLVRAPSIRFAAHSKSNHTPVATCKH